jgi:predicted Zn-ribbon and HTH transcriptional regulator
MELEIEQQFFQYLSELGFPKSSVVYEPVFQPIRGGRRYRPDFALLDPKTNEPLAIIEIKVRNDQDTLSRATQQLQQYIAALRDKGIRGFVVTPAQSGCGFDFYTSNEDGKPKQVPSSSFLQFESLSSARIAEKKEMLAGEKKETTDQFLIVCFVAAAFAVAITIADFVCSRYNITLLTTERMTLVGAAIVLAIIPYVEKLKAFGIEIDRAAKQAKG